MSQTLHIFKKDVRHLWPEIVISLVLTIAFVRTSLLQLFNYREPSTQIYAMVLSALVPVSWWVLTIRLVQEESLVGESQFWITRPYQWKKLLTAKALFLLAFVYLPFILAQTAILAGAGFHPFTHPAAFLYNLLLITTFLILPVIAIATVTGTFSRSVITLLSTIAYLALIFWAVSFIPQATSSFPDPYSTRLNLALFFIVFLLAIVLQYATRHTWRSRWLLLVLPFLAIFCFLALPVQVIARHLYPPAATEQSPIRFAFDPSPEHIPAKPALTGTTTERVDLRLPLTVSGVPSNSLLVAQAVQISIETSTGNHWNSQWQSNPAYFRSSNSRSTIDLLIDRRAFERLHSASAKVVFTFAFTQLQTENPVTIPVGDYDFTLPNGGICSPSTGFGTTCRFALTDPRLLLSTAIWSDNACSKVPPEFSFGGWTGVAEPGIAEFGLNPVRIRPLNFSNGNGFVGNHSCTPTQITTTPYSVVRHLQTTFTTPEIDLTKYALDNHEKFGSGTKTAISVSAQ